MLQPTFDGSTKRIAIAAGTTTLDLVALHSYWKIWVLAGNASCLIAFGTVGGEIAAIPLYLFLQNGWKIVPQAADHVLTVANGILETSDGSDPFVDPAGTYKIRINRATPGIAIGYVTGSGVTSQDKTDIAAATLAAAQVTPIQAITQDNVIEGTLTEAEAQRIMLAALAGRVTKTGTNIKFKSVDGLTDRIDGTVDTEGNRTAVTLDGAA